MHQREETPRGLRLGRIVGDDHRRVLREVLRLVQRPQFAERLFALVERTLPERDVPEVRIRRVVQVDDT